jgi:hypothetical protein
VGRRLNAVLDEIAGGPTEGRLELPGRSTVDRAFLKFKESSQHIQLEVYPADTLTQAKAFYTRPGATASVLSLRDAGWNVEPNFHFGFMAAGFVWTTADAPVEKYTAYWCERIDSTGAIPREKWGEFWRDLVRQRFARTDDKTQFDQLFTDTKRGSATPRPGLSCSYSWGLSEAKVLDNSNKLVAVVADQLNIVLRALGEKPIKSLKSSEANK